MENLLKVLGPRDLRKFKEKQFLFIAGPCVIEDANSTIKIATELTKISNDLNVPFVFKASYDKANRTSIKSFRGVGIKEGLAILNHIRDELLIPVLSDVHETWQVEQAAKVLDIIQIPAFLCRQTDLVIEAAKTNKLINIKKGQYMSPDDMGYIVNKVFSTGNKRVLLTERGTFFGYGNLVNDFKGIKDMNKFAPVIYDATHSVQLPGQAKGASGGAREYVPQLTRAAIASGASGLFLETHYDPLSSPSDSTTIFPLDKVHTLLSEALMLFNTVLHFHNWELDKL